MANFKEIAMKRRGLRAVSSLEIGEQRLSARMMRGTTAPTAVDRGEWNVMRKRRIASMEETASDVAKKLVASARDRERHAQRLSVEARSEKQAIVGARLAARVAESLPAMRVEQLSVAGGSFGSRSFFPEQSFDSKAASDKKYVNVFKRMFDVFLAVSAMPVFLPLILISALLVMIDGGRPFYSHMRVGRNGHVFRMWKLRTMVVDADAKLEAYLRANPSARAEWAATMKLKNDPRITSLGRFLRKSSLDELPQFLNVLNGNMSLVGPLALTVDQSSLYDGQAYYRLRPGLTGPWQISGRNDLSFADRARCDHAYAQSISFTNDLRILFRTVGVVIRCNGY